MLNKKLEKWLRKDLRKELEDTEKIGKPRMEEALREGDMLGYFSWREEWRLPDIYWALERYGEAKQWYRHNAQNFIESRQWEEAHLDEINADLQRKGYDFEHSMGVSPREAATFVKAGMMERGREFLRRAYEYEKERAGAASAAMRRLALQAAQVGMKDLADRAMTLDKEGRGPAPEPKEIGQTWDEVVSSTWDAEKAFLLGDYQVCEHELEKVLGREQFLHSAGEVDTEGELFFATAYGLRAVLDMLGEREGKGTLYKKAVEHLEQAMHLCLRVAFDEELYFLRLYTLMGLDILEGRTPNPNPFAGDACPPDGAVSRACRAVK